MSGQATADCSVSVNPVPAYEELTPPDDHIAKADAGWWIVPCVALGAAFWAVILSWMFGFW
jgi:hypothetical protein